jgi:hypothetical protein
MQYDSETLSLTTNNLKDIDRDNHDSFAQGGDDCDDWPYAGSCTDLFTDPDIVSCSTDSDNDGIKDYVGCAQCKHPGVVEEADDIDNNCQGTCQGNPSRSCTVSGYSGDGAKDNSIIPIHSNPDDPLSPIIGYSGCGNVRNSFNKIDEFCQMVDDNVGADNGDICNGYQRAVKWGERKINLRSELDHNDNNYFYYNVYYTLYSFIPGGDGQNTQCYKKDVTESVACDYSGIPPYPDNFDINNPNKYGCSYATIKEESNVQSCMPNSEASGKTRGTQQTESTIFPDQFIDSFRGELYFNDFLRIPEVNGILQETDPGTGNFKWQWHTSCVLKDKCNDGVSNSMPQDLFTLEPYKYYLIPSIPDSSEEGKIKFVSSSPNINNHLYVSLVDVDDPSCKFNSPENPASTKQGGLPVYSTDAYKINPLYPSQTVYCLDQDRDGFCGCIMKTMYKVCKSGPTAFGECPLFMSTDWVEEGTKSALLSTYHGDGAYVLDTKISCDESLNENYIMSKHFPDCDDNNYVSYIIQTDSPKKREKILTTPSLGWGNSPELIGKEYSSWNVHPFAPVTPITCTRGYDFNCNKDYIEGYNVDSLKTGETMFDWDLKTGTEKFASTSSDEKKVDNACYLKGALSAGLEEAGNQVNQQISMITSPLGIGVITLSFFCPPCGAVVGMGLSTYMTASAITYPKILGTNEGKVDWAQFILGTTGMLDSGLAITHFHIGVRNLYPPGTEITTKQYFNLVQKIGGIKLIKRKPAQAETPKAGCFLENTSIILSDGSFKDIQDILVGDEVMAYDLINNKPVNATVSATFIRNETKYRVIQYEIIE